MIRLGRSAAVVGTVLAIAVAFAVGAAGGAAAKRTVSPCGTANAPTWSPDGTQVAWFGYRWPRPHNHAVGSWNTLRAICVSAADGTHLRRLPNTACSARCSHPWADPVGRLDWVSPTLLLAGNDLAVFAISIGQKPQLLVKTGPAPYAIDTNGDRVAAGAFPASCVHCAGPVKIRVVPSGAAVGTVGGTKVNNTEPSLSPDGTQVVFSRYANGSGRNLGIWTAVADGTHLKRLERHGGLPLWSPTGNRIAYLAPAGSSRYDWRLVSPQGGASTTLMRNGFATVFGWSPNGRWFAFPDSKGRLAVVSVATKKVRTLLKLQLPYSSSSAAWSPDSQQLLVVARPPAHTSCPSGLWRVPVDGGKPHLVHGC